MHLASSLRSSLLVSFRPSTLRSLLLAPVAALALGACNEVETGRYGNVDFTPDDCGRLFCDLDDRLAMGATTDVTLDATDGSVASGLELVSEAPFIFDVVDQESGGSWPRFTVRGVAPGRADLIAVDWNGDEVDYIPVEVVRIDDIVLEVSGDRVIGPDTIITGSGERVERYRVAPGSHLRIQASAEADRAPVMGKFDYGVVVGPAIGQALTSASEPSRGRFELFAPAGEHDLQLLAPGGAWKRVHLTVQ